MQEVMMPEIDSSLVGKRITMCFELVLEDESLDMLWCRGVIEDATGGSYDIVTIRWDKDFLCEGEPEVQNHKLLVRKYNPKLGKCVNVA